MKIDESQILLNEKAKSKNEAIIKIGERMLSNGLIESEYIDSMLNKEKTDVTFIGNGVAIPHGLDNDRVYVKKPGIIIAQFPYGVDWGNDKAFLVIGIASKNNEHLELLQDLAIKLSDINYVNKLVNCTSIQSFLEIFNNGEVS